MIKLSERLQKVSDFVLDDKISRSIIDVGCDHALLDIYLLQSDETLVVTASDINEGPLQKALENIKKYSLQNKIKVQQANGIEILPSDTDTIVISGMGMDTIVQILNDNKENLSNIKKLVISSNNKFYQVREKITKLGFIIESEEIVLEDGKYYIIMKFIKGNKNYSYKELYFGPCLLENKNRMFYKYYTYLKDEKENILSMIPGSLSNKRHVINEEIKMLTLEIKS